MHNKTLIALLLACSPTLALAHNLTLGAAVPAVTVEQHGEIQLQQQQFSYQAWNSQHMVGKVRVIQAIAGRSSAKQLNAPLMAAISAAKFPSERYQTTTIINQDDALWGTGALVKSSAQDSKQQFPWSSMVLDKSGAVAKAWQLPAESSTIIVLDEQGQVLWVKEGALSEAEIASVLGLIEQQL
ncbi:MULTISPECIES: YtfJ family protein [Vibrio]|uniref:YtfJ family protein n=1 Tax=Vibrio chanodichtyis TaxID=3027932 RepID=A0ABT5V066_9VIBR|nr:MULTISPECIES: YtfJ family protein [Vibrio]MDE1515062.1 YtfJ family protein [Vibrio chanodichtyis]